MVANDRDAELLESRGWIELGSMEGVTYWSNLRKLLGPLTTEQALAIESLTLLRRCEK